MIKVKLTTDRPLPPEAQKWLEDAADKITAEINKMDITIIDVADAARVIHEPSAQPVAKSQIAQSINRILEE